MNVFNVHSNRSPVDGEVKERLVSPRAGSSTPPSTRPRSRTSATRCGCGPTTARDVTCVQVAGLIARRILCYVEPGDRLARGQRYGFIRFGSRVDVYLPLDAQPKVAIWATRCSGDGSTILAALVVTDRLMQTCRNHLRQDRSIRPADARRRGIYLLPNLFTTAALFAGFYAIVQAMNERFEHAAVAIFVAMVLDGLDGRVARLTHTQSEFGAEYDSPLRHGVLRRRAGAGDVRVGAARTWASSAGSPPSSTAPARRCGWRASTPRSTWSTSATSRACPARRRRRWWPAWSGCASTYGMRGQRDALARLADLTLFAGLTMVSNVPLLQRQGHQPARTACRSSPCC